MSRLAGWVVAGLLTVSPGWSAQKPEAIEMLEEQRGQCAGGPEGQACRQILDYSKGYVLQQESEASADPAGSLREAAAAYRKVLADSPANVPTLDNLVTVYQRLGEPEEAIPYLENAVASGTAPPRMAVQLGDLLLQQDRAEEAKALFQKALAMSPDDEEACRRLVLGYELSPGASGAADLLSLGESWEETVPSAARDAYEAVMRLARTAGPAGPGNSDLAESALVRWVDLLGRSGGVSVADLDRLPEDWTSPAFTELRAWVSRPESRPGSWWRLNPRGSSALAATALAIGRERLAGGEPAKAEAVWRAGQELGRFSDAAYTDLRTDLALLYFRHRELDRGGDKFQSIENQLFVAQLSATMKRDLASAQRLHTALGLIYAERGTWKSALPQRGAVLQLEYALDAAAVRDRAEDMFQPLPWLRERLGDGYSALGRKRKAAAAYLEAARAYLDMDDLGNAAKMIKTGHALAEPAWEGSAEAARLLIILDGRRQLADGAEQRPGQAQALRLARFGNAWLDPSWSHPDEEFRNRQRFKALADLATVEERSGQSEPALRHAVQALEMALGSDDRVYLTGAGDLLRLQRLQALSAGSLGLKVPAPGVVPDRETQDTLPLALPSGGPPARIRLSPEGAVANRIVLALGADTVLAFHPRLEIEEGGKILILDVRPDTDVAALMERMSRADGIGEVVYDPGRAAERTELLRLLLPEDP